MTAANNEAIKQWFARLDQLQPADGQFNEEVLAAAGGFPVHKPPGDAYDNRHDPVKSTQYGAALTARAFAQEMASFRATMARGRATDGSAEAEETDRLKAQYWRQIAAWLENPF